MPSNGRRDLIRRLKVNFASAQLDNVPPPPPTKIPYRNALSTGREVHQSPPSNAGIKNEWNYNCPPPHAFISYTNVNKQQILAYILCVGFCWHWTNMVIIVGIVWICGDQGFRWTCCILLRGWTLQKNSTRQTTKGVVTDNAFRNTMKCRVTSVVPAGRQGEMCIDSREVHQFAPPSLPMPPQGFPCPLSKRNPFILVSIPHTPSLFGLWIN